MSVSRMAGYLTTCGCKRAIDAVFLAPGKVLWLGASRLAANREGRVEEPRGADYGRCPVLANLVLARDEAGGLCNFAPLPLPTPESDWGEVRSVFLADSDRDLGGEVLAMADLLDGRRITAESGRVWVGAGALRLGMR